MVFTTCSVYFSELHSKFEVCDRFGIGFCEIKTNVLCDVDDDQFAGAIFLTQKASAVLYRKVREKQYYVVC